MKTRELRAAYAQFIDHYRLRPLPRLKRYVGIYRGVLLCAFEFDGVITLDFFAPTADLGNQPFEKFSGFTHWHDAGLPAAWLRPRDSAETCGCVVTLDGNRLERLGVDGFLELPQTVADDLQSFGAGESIMCSGCGQRAASEASLIDWHYAWHCHDCWQAVSMQADRGGIPVSNEISWQFAAPLFVILTLAGALGWGWLQQPGVLPPDFIPGLHMLPIGWGCLVCRLLMWRQAGSSRALRWLMGVSVVLSVLLGNIWGFHATLEQQGPIDWAQSVPLYFTFQLCQNLGGELPYLFGGVIGVWIGIYFARTKESILVD